MSRVFRIAKPFFLPQLILILNDFTEGEHMNVEDNSFQLIIDYIRFTKLPSSFLKSF